MRAARPVGAAADQSVVVLPNFLIHNVTLLSSLVSGSFRTFNRTFVSMQAMWRRSCLGVSLIFTHRQETL